MKTAFIRDEDLDDTLPSSGNRELLDGRLVNERILILNANSVEIYFQGRPSKNISSPRPT